MTTKKCDYWRHRLTPDKVIPLTRSDKPRQHWLVVCGLTSYSAIFQLYSDRTVVQFPNLDLLPSTRCHGQQGVFSVPSLPRQGHWEIQRRLLPPCHQRNYTQLGYAGNRTPIVRSAVQPATSTPRRWAIKIDDWQITSCLTVDTWSIRPSHPDWQQTSCIRYVYLQNRQISHPYLHTIICLFGCFEDFTLLWQYFCHIVTWKQEIYNFWNRSGDPRFEPRTPCSASQVLTTPPPPLPTNNSLPFTHDNFK